MNGAIRSSTILACALLALALPASCTPSSGGRMVSEAPPAGWEQELLEARARKDRSFREGADTPLLAEDLATFEGLEYWPPRPELRFVGPIHLFESRQQFTIPTTAGALRPCEKYGWLSFVLDGQVSVLQIYRMLDNPLDDESSLFLPFTDETSGRETYPAGRYVDLHRLDDGRWVLDFNLAMNPFCAYGAPERFACPVAPAANRLASPIEAGERGYKHAGGA